MHYTDTDLAQLVPLPAPDAHKYSRGKAVVVAGSARYPGAACLAAKATQLSGAGYTQVFTAAKNVSLLQAFRPSLVVAPFDELDPESAVPAGHPGAFVVGPGFDAACKELASRTRSCIEGAAAPLLLDGGALAFCAKKKARSALAARAAAGRITVLTPHEGEAARLGAAVGLELDRNDDPLLAMELRRAFAQELALRYQATVVLKGPDTLVALPYGREVTVLSEGTVALAKAGTGDVLAGIIGGFLAQGLASRDAAVLGVSVHAWAGRLAAQRYGVVSACAEEVLEYVPAAIQRLVALRK